MNDQPASGLLGLGKLERPSAESDCLVFGRLARMEQLIKLLWWQRVDQNSIRFHSLIESILIDDPVAIRPAANEEPRQVTALVRPEEHFCLLGIAVGAGFASPWKEREIDLARVLNDRIDVPGRPHLGWQRIGRVNRTPSLRGRRHAGDTRGQALHHDPNANGHG